MSKVIAKLLKFRVSHVGDERFTRLNTAGQVILLDVAAFIAGQTRGQITGSIEVPLTCRSIGSKPDREGFRRSLVLAIHGEAHFFQLVGNIIAHGLACAITIRADEEDQGYRFAVDLPLAILTKSSAHGFHFGCDLSASLFKVIGILGFESTGSIHQVGIFHQLGGDRQKFRQ